MAAYTKNLAEKWTALYVRLSRDDENEGDSNSIAHQIEILTKYCKDHGITRHKIYKDDGFSGTNFNRPGFKEMLSDIEAGLVGAVIVKDMSRFGRNYLEVGLYTEIRFPELGVRFIAVNDGVDSDDQMGNDFTPFRNIINEWYAKDTSKKVRAVFRNKGMSGQRLGGIVPYGYIKDETGQLVIDEETAPIVKLIFQLCVEGNGTGKIARILKEREIPTPGTIIFQRTGRAGRYHPDNPCLWRGETISGILAQDAYLGQTTNFKYSKPSFKSKKIARNPPEKRMLFENTQEAIIEESVFLIVQNIRQGRRRPTKMGDMGMFSGLVYCADCGGKMYLCRTNHFKPEQEYYICSTYRKDRSLCKTHSIRRVVLEEIVLRNLREAISYVTQYEDDFIQRAAERSLRERDKALSQKKTVLVQSEKRIAELDVIFKRIYEDVCCKG